MTKRQKLLLLIELIAMLVIGAWLSLRSSAPASVDPTPAPTPPKIAGPAQHTAAPIAAPVAPPAATSNSAAVTLSAPAPATADPPAFDPRAAQVKAEIDPMISAMRDGNQEMLRDSTVKIPHEEIQAMIMEEEALLQITPTLNEAGDIATYRVDDATWAGINAYLAGFNHRPLNARAQSSVYQNENGHWHYGASR